jgi:acetoacetate decarboxylase
MAKTKSGCIVLLLVLGTAVSCLAQNFEGTNLSSTEPFYARNPYIFEGSENYFITFNTDPAVIRALVPEPLTPISSQMTFIFARHKLTHPFKLDYNEAYFFTLVSYGETVGIYIPVLYLDKVEAIIPGREIIGYNKVGAEFEVVEKDNEISVSVTQMGRLIIKTSFTLGEAFAPPVEQPKVPVINLKYMPSAQKDAPPDVKKLIISAAQNSRTAQMRLGTATLEFYSAPFNPLNEIPILKIDKAGSTLDSFTLSYGDVLHDYLKEGKQANSAGGDGS